MKLKAWLQLGLSLIGWSLVCGMFFVVIGFIGEGFELLGPLSCLPMYILFCAAIFAVLMSMTTYLSYLPLYLSLGSTRKETWLGLHMMQLVLAAGCTAIAALLCLILPGDPPRDLISLLPAALLAILAFAKLGSAAGCIALLFPKVGRALSVVLCMVFSGAAGFVGASATMSFPDSFRLSLPGRATLIVGAVLAALLLVELLFQRRALPRYEVRL